MVGDDTIGLPLISLIIQLGHLSQLKSYRLCNFESNYKQCNMKSISVILIGLILDGCSSVQRVNGWYPVADVPENRIEGKAIVTVKDFDVISLDTVSYPDMAVIEGRLKADMIQKWADVRFAHTSRYELRQRSVEDTRHHPQYEERTVKLKADVPQLETIISKTWGKEDELKQLKSELAALDRKITAELAPKHDENDGTENKQEQSQQSQPAVKSETVVNTVNVHITDPPQGHKPSMVAEPQLRYSMPASVPRFPVRHSGI